jgi:hypothetical protein
MDNLLTNPSDPGKVEHMNKTTQTPFTLERGQIRRWNSIPQYAWELVCLPGDPNPPDMDALCHRNPATDVLGRYIKPHQKFGRKDARVPYTTATEWYAKDRSDIVEELHLEINVTQEDIDSGTCGSFTECAISRAALRAVRRRFRRWAVLSLSTSTGLSVNTKGEFENKFWARLPRAATAFIDLYDSGNGKKLAKPFKFRIDLPPRVTGPRRTKYEW